MSLAHHLTRIRSKPEAERRRLATMWTVVSVLAVVIIWVANIYATFGVGASVEQASAPSPFAQVKLLFTDMTASVKYSSESTQ